MSEFRKHGRKPIRCSIKLTHHDLGDIIAETKNISETGVFIAHKDLVHYMSVGEQVEACFYSEENSAYDGVLKVIRLTDEGIGLEFV